MLKGEEEWRRTSSDTIC